jgi:hypothetical protein
MATGPTFGHIYLACEDTDETPKKKNIARPS